MKLSDEFAKTIPDYLNLYPEVTWDRYCSPKNDAACFYGWIARRDGLRDYFALYFHKGEIYSYQTTSAKYSLEFARRLQERIGRKVKHIPCRRVEDLALPINCIHLAKKEDYDQTITPQA
jgi:hypothetical protein